MLRHLAIFVLLILMAGMAGAADKTPYPHVFGGDTANYTGWMKMADSINNGAWVWRGLLIKAKTALAYGDLLILYSAESANDPVFWYESFALSQQATGGATTDRHGETNRHGAYRH